MFDPVAAIGEFVRHPSVSADPGFAAGMVGARDFIAAKLAEIGLAVRIVPSPKHPFVLAKREGPAHWPHVLLYGHYDVQPPDPLDLWLSPAFEPTIRNGRLYGRGAADNKGPFLVHVAALGYLLEKHPDLPLRVTVMVEGEEEIGSPSFPGFLEAYRDELQADFVLLSDTASPNTEQIAITVGLRGIVTVEAEVTGPKGDLHSGLHGGVLLNPIQALADLVASLHTPDGRVNIPGFYDDVRPVEQWERDELQHLGLSEEQYRQWLGIPAFHPTPGYTPFESVRFQPTLEFNGFGGGYQGVGSKTVIPSKAFVKISCRLVPNMVPEKIEALVKQAISERLSPKVTLRFLEGHHGAPYLVVPPGRPNTPADQSPALARAFRAADSAIAAAFGGKRPLYLREGGSVPLIATIRDVLGMDSLMMGIFTADDNLHAPNESIHLGMFERGVQASMGILHGFATGK